MIVSTQTSSVLSLVVACIACAVFAAPVATADADSTFSVESYIPEKFTDLEWKLDGGFSFSGDSRDDESNLGPLTTNVSEGRGSSYTRRNANIGNQIRYRYETVQRTLNLSLNSNGYYYNNDYGSSRRDIYSSSSTNEQESWSKQEYYSVSLYPSADGRTYLHEDVFISASVKGRLVYREYPKNDSRSIGNRYEYRDWDSTGSTRLTQSIRDRHEDWKSYTASVSLMPGWGRAYEGEYAATALYIIDEIRSNGLLENEPTYEQMLKLTNIIHQYRLKHYLDHRLHRIEAVEVIAEYLKSAQIVADPDPTLSLLIEDVWRYFPVFDRRFGLLIRAGLGIDYDYRSEQRTEHYEYRSTRILRHADDVDTVRHSGSQHYFDYDKTESTLPYVIARVDYYKPLDIRWQLDADAEAVYYVGARTRLVDKYMQYSPDYYSDAGTQRFEHKSFYTVDCAATLRYIFNSRTYASLSGNLGYGHLRRENDEHFDYVSQYGSPSERSAFETISFGQWNYTINMSIIYRISIPTRLTLSAYYANGRSLRDVFLQYDMYETDGYRFSAGISHYIL